MKICFSHILNACKTILSFKDSNILIGESNTVVSACTSIALMGDAPPLPEHLFLLRGIVQHTGQSPSLDMPDS